jgi:hypothetical protein
VCAPSTQTPLSAHTHAQHGEKQQQERASESLFSPLTSIIYWHAPKLFNSGQGENQSVHRPEAKIQLQQNEKERAVTEHSGCVVAHLAQCGEHFSRERVTKQTSCISQHSWSERSIFSITLKMSYGEVTNESKKHKNNIFFIYGKSR